MWQRTEHTENDAERGAKRGAAASTAAPARRPRWPSTTRKRPAPTTQAPRTRARPHRKTKAAAGKGTAKKSNGDTGDVKVEADTGNAAEQDVAKQARLGLLRAGRLRARHHTVMGKTGDLLRHL